MLPREYSREAYKRGLAYEARLGVNPFKFGMIGSTDSHTSLSTAQEDNFFGKVVLLEPSADPIRFEEVIAGRPAPPGSQIYARETSASGLAAVWARENTREALWDAMARKEVYATTGTRIRVRVFGGFDFGPDDLQRSDFAAHAYRNGVPMGGDLTSAPEGKAPAFLVQALRDPDGANLDLRHRCCPGLRRRELPACQMKPQESHEAQRAEAQSFGKAVFQRAWVTAVARQRSSTRTDAMSASRR